MAPCETCEGSGRVIISDTDVVDRGTTWQRSAEQRVDVECPSCHGDGIDRVTDLGDPDEDWDDEEDDRDDDGDEDDYDSVEQDV